MTFRPTFDLRAWRGWMLLAVAGAAAACGGGGSTPTSPTPPPVTTTGPTRIVAVSGDLAYGEIPVGGRKTATITISNRGTDVLTVNSITVNGGLAPIMTTTWQSGTIAAGASQEVTLGFAPTAEGTYSGTLFVNGDQTSGFNTLAISATAIVTFSGSYAGAHVIKQCNGGGSAQDLICSDAHGLYKVGTRFLIELTIVQNGNGVTGTVNLAGTTGAVSGTVNGGVLTLSGTATDALGYTAVISSWSTTLAGSGMAGSLSYSLTYRGIPGNAGIVADLDGVTRR